DARVWLSRHGPWAWIRQTSGGCSPVGSGPCVSLPGEGVNAGGSAIAGEPSTTGSQSSTVLRSTVNAPPAGGGQTFGQSAPASESRTRCPLSKTHDVASSAIVPSVGAPGSSGSGSVDELRCARLRTPRDTRAEVPSGNTS